MAIAAQQIGTSAKFRHQNVPATTVTWTDPNDETGSVTATIFSEISKSPYAGVNYEQIDNDGELTGLKTARRGFDLSFSCIPIGATAAAALAVAEQMPFINTELTITAASDAQCAGVCYCQSASVRYTPDGDTVMDITARKYITSAGATIDLAAEA